MTTNTGDPIVSPALAEFWARIDGQQTASKKSFDFLNAYQTFGPSHLQEGEKLPPIQAEVKITNTRPKPPFTKTGRKTPVSYWRGDFLVDRLVWVELEGGAWINGGHNRGKGFIDNCYKYNAVTKIGYSLLRFETGMLKDDADACVALVLDVWRDRWAMRRALMGADL